MTPPRSRALRLATAAAALFAGGLAACGDPLGARANLETSTDTLVVYALSDTVAARRDYPTALLTAASTSVVDGQVTVEPRVTSATGLGDFDIAFDVDGAGKVVLIPQRRLLTAAGSRSVGLLKSSVPFEQLFEAPRGNYQFDTVAVTVSRGETVVLQTQTPGCLNDARGASPVLFSKLVVDSVQAGTQAIFFRLVVDPNCGFRSFRSGVPGN